VHLKRFGHDGKVRRSPITRNVGRSDEAAVVLRRSGHCKEGGWILRRWKRISGRFRMRIESWRVAFRDNRQNGEEVTGLSNNKLCRPVVARFVAAAVAPARTSRMHWMVFKSLGKRFLRHPLLIISVLKVESAGCGWFGDLLEHQRRVRTGPALKDRALLADACVRHRHQPPCRTRERRSMLG
jgi:hypothetical protein